MSAESAKQTYDLIQPLVKTIQHEAYCNLRIIDDNIFMNVGTIRISVTHRLIKVGNYRMENMLQTRDEFIHCLQYHCARLENIRAEFAAALPQPIAEEIVENFTILPALVRFIPMINHYKFQRADGYNDRWLNTSYRFCAE